MAVLYAPSLGYGFVYEDLNDPEAFFLQLSPAETIRSTVLKPFRSLTKLSYLVNQALAGAQNPVGYHAGNLVLHALNGWLLFLVGRRVIGAWPAVVAVGLFLLHPVQVESVAYVSSRHELISVAAVLVGLLLIERPWLAFLACGVAVLGKETAITAYLLMPFAAWVLGYRWSWPVRVVWGLFLAVPAGFLIVGYGMAFDMRYALEQLAALTRLLALIVWPVGLTIDHDWTVITPAVCLLVLTVWAVVGMVAWERRWSALLAVMGWVLLAMAPRFVVPLVEGLHEHHLYLPMVGIALGLGWLVKEHDGIRLQRVSAHAA